MNPVYFDNAATTPVREEVITAITHSLKNTFGNPSSTHSYGRSAKSRVESCRKTIASLLNAEASEIVFTSGGTEGDNMVLQSAVATLGVTHIITSKIEHHAVLHTIQELEKRYGITVSYVQLQKNGLIDLAHLEALLQKATQKTLVSLMHVNNETGAVLDLEQTGHLCRQYQALFHSDTVQSIGKYILDVKKIPIDFAVASAHKFHGPKGVGFLFVRNRSGLKSVFYGGEQERGYRPGTEAVHNIVGLTEALKLAYQYLDAEKEHIYNLKTYFVTQLKTHLPEIKFNSPTEKKLASDTILNVRFPGSATPSSLFLFQLDLKGIACSQGSACQSGSLQGSHVLQEILTSEELAQPSLRFSLSCFNTRQEVDYVVQTLTQLTRKAKTS